MSVETQKEHRLYVVITTDQSWKTEAVAEKVQDMLIESQDEDGPFEEVIASADPINEDTEIPEAMEGTLSLMDIYTEFLREKAEQGGTLEIFREGMERIEHGITDLKACARCLRTISAQQMLPSFKVQMIDKDNLEEAPEEVLHALAHRLGLEPPECEMMNRDDMIKWIKEHTEPPRTIN